MEKDTKSKKLVLPELTDAVMQKMHETARNIYVNLKREGTVNGSNDDIMDSAIVLAIFGVCNPDNIPMQEEEIQIVFSAYKDWISRTMFN